MPLHGHLELVCGLDSLGRPALLRQSFSAPMHLSKSHREAETLLVNVINPTAGLFSGDAIRCAVKVESGAKLLLTSPSASRAHTMAGGEAQMEQSYEVARCGRLELWPELFIPQKNARYCQKTTVRLEEGAELFFYESLAPGRVASGEVFAFDRLSWETDIYWADRLVARERYTLEPNDASVSALRDRFPTGYYATCFLFSPKLAKESPCWEIIHLLHTDEVWTGVSALVAGGWTVKVLASDSVSLRNALSTIRASVYTALGDAPPSLRRV